MSFLRKLQATLLDNKYLKIFCLVHVKLTGARTQEHAVKLVEQAHKEKKNLFDRIETETKGMW